MSLIPPPSSRATRVNSPPCWRQHVMPGPTSPSSTPPRTLRITRQARTTAAVILNAAPVQGPLVVQARTAIAGYEVEMVPVVVHHRIAQVYAFTDGLTAAELTRASKAGTELIAVFRWVQNKRTITQWPDLILKPRSSAPDAPPLPLLRGPREPARRAC